MSNAAAIQEEFMNASRTIPPRVGGGGGVRGGLGVRPIQDHPLDLTVGLDSPPDVWMETDDLDLLDDDEQHAACGVCYPVAPRAMEPFLAMCGRRALAYRDMGADNALPPNYCPDCRDCYGCPACGTVFG